MLVGAEVDEDVLGGAEIVLVVAMPEAEGRRDDKAALVPGCDVVYRLVDTVAKVVGCAKREVVVVVVPLATGTLRVVVVLEMTLFFVETDALILTDLDEIETTEVEEAGLMAAGGLPPHLATAGPGMAYALPPLSGRPLLP